MDAAVVELKRAAQEILALHSLIPPGGPRRLEEVRQQMDELISPEFEPYFLANAALHLLAQCERCGRCCREERRIAVSIEDCRRIARALGLSQKRFLAEYTAPHELKGGLVGSARMLRKTEAGPCPFYDSALPGCRVHSVKPQVCRAAHYLSKMNLILCEERKEVSSISGCPADARLRCRLQEFRQSLDADPRARTELEALLSPGGPEGRVFLLLLRLKGMEIYFGAERAQVLARRLGLAGVPGDGEMRGAAWGYAVKYLTCLCK